MKILDSALKYEEYVISLRRYFHEHPELSGQEYKTVEKISEELENMGIEHVVIPEGGVLAKIVGTKDNGRSVLLRADVDALEIDESPNNSKYSKTSVSKVCGVMHACGHDAHTAMLLGAAKILSERRDEIFGTVYLCFERGEENAPNLENIFAYIDENGVSIDSVFGMHLQVGVPTGKIAINDKDMMAGNIGVAVKLYGKGGHGSRPDEANNPIDCFSALYQRLQSIRMTKITPFETCTFSVGYLHAGTSANVIPNELSFNGMIRYFSREKVEKNIIAEFENAIDSFAESYGCRAEYRIKLINPSVVNTAALAVMARKAVTVELGEENAITFEPWMASESFSKYLDRWSGVFAFLGIRNEDKGITAPHHSPEFDVDESALKNGVTAYVSYAIEYLKSNV